MAQSQITYDCPYRVGAILHVEIDELIIDVEIIKIFIGGEDQQFSNSCTMLVQRSIAHPMPISVDWKLPAQFVIKIMDWRFSMSIRERYGVGAWTSDSQEQLSRMKPEEQDKFEQLLASKVSEADMQQRLVKALLQNGTIPRKPLWVDIYEYIMTLYPALLARFVSSGTIPHHPSLAEREVFIRFKNKEYLAAEAKIAEVVDSCLPGSMPQAYGVCSIRTSSQSGDINVRFPLDTKDETEIWGLAMSYVTGQPLALLDAASLEEQTVRDLLDQFQEYQRSLCACNLQFVDANLHNLLVTQGHDDRSLLTVVDYGAIQIVSSSPENNPCCQVTLPGRSESQCICQEYRADRYYSSIEIMLLEGIAKEYSGEFPDLSRYSDDLATRSISLNNIAGLDQVIWHTIMRELRRSVRSAASRTAGHDWRAIHAAASFMYSEFADTNLYEDPWWRRALAGIESLTGHALRVSESIEMLTQKFAVVDNRALDLSLSSARGSLKHGIVQVIPREDDSCLATRLRGIKGQ